MFRDEVVPHETVGSCPASDPAALPATKRPVTSPRGHDSKSRRAGVRPARPAQRSRGTGQRRQRRVAALLSHAWDVVARVGIAGLSMEELAKEAGYTRSGIYRYFRSKEDIAIALAVESVQQRVWLFDQVMHFDVSPRHRLIAFVEGMCRLFPRHALVNRTAFANALYSERKQRVLHDLSRQDFRHCLELTRQGVDRGELPLPRGMAIETLTLAVYGFTRGIYTSACDAPLLAECGVGDLRQASDRILSDFLDGLGWRPMASEPGYDETLRRIRHELLVLPLATPGPWGPIG